MHLTQIASHRRTGLFVVAMLTALLGLASTTFAQEIEEVVIQAEQIEDQPLDDLVSVSVLDAGKLADAGIENVEDVAAYVPNLVLTQTDTGTNIVIRGIGAGVNQGFDQSVGLYVDGVPLPRSQMARATFLDLANVQVLRGPQYVWDGNYSIAGSVHMATQIGGDEFGASFDLNYIPSQNDRTLLFSAGGPVSDNFSARVAVQRKLSDGYVENVLRNESGPQQDEVVGRFSLGWQPSEAMSVRFKAEIGQFDTRGRAIEILSDEVAAADLLGGDIDGVGTPTGILVPAGTTIPTPGLAAGQIIYRETQFDLTRDGRHGGATPLATPWLVESDLRFRPQGIRFDAPADGLLSQVPPTDPYLGYYFAGRSYTQKLAETYARVGAAPPTGLLDTSLDFRRAADIDEFSDNKSKNYTLNIDRWLGAHRLFLTSSYIEYEFDESIDSDFTPVPLLATSQAEQYEQRFHRLEFHSPADGFLEYRLGASHLDSDLQFNDRTTPLTDAESTPSGFTRPVIEAFFGGIGGALGDGVVSAVQNGVIDRNFDQQSEVTAVFADMVVNWQDSFRTRLGVRYTHSEKSAVRDLAFLSSDGRLISEAADVTTIRNAFRRWLDFFGVKSHTDRYDSSVVGVGGNTAFVEPALRGTRRDEALLPSITLELDLGDSLSTFASARLANKLGGFDARSNSTPNIAVNSGFLVGTFEFEDENALTYELGFNWFHALGQTTLVGFFTDFDDLQLSRFDGRFGFNVDNAGAARSMGVEIEGLLEFTESFNLNYSLAWIDFEFQEFRQGTCHLGVRPDWFFVGVDFGGDLTTVDYDFLDLDNSGTISRGDYIPIQFGALDDYSETSESEGFIRPAINNAVNGSQSPKALRQFDDTSLAAAAFCDFEGRTNQYVAQTQGTFSFNYEKELVGGQLLFKPTLDVLYNSGYHTAASQDPVAEQGEYFQFNGRLALGSIREVWELALTAQNITNEKIVSYANDTPIGARLQGARGFYGFVRPPRTIGINMRYKFY